MDDLGATPMNWKAPYGFNDLWQGDNISESPWGYNWDVETIETTEGQTRRILSLAAGVTLQKSKIHHRFVCL
jgi:hypothetical protein